MGYRGAGYREARGGMTVAIIDAIRKTKPPFSPADTIRQYAELLTTYRVTRVRGDRFAGEFPRELFREHGIVPPTPLRIPNRLTLEAAPAAAFRLQRAFTSDVLSSNVGTPSPARLQAETVQTALENRRWHTQTRTVSLHAREHHARVKGVVGIGLTFE